METRPFHKDVQQLRADVLGMGKLASGILGDAMRALEERKPELAVAVLARDPELDRMDVALETRIFELIALHQPMARDLRALGGSVKIITYTDRIGRYGYDIAVAALSAMEADLPPPSRGLFTMANAAQDMVRGAFEAYARDDAAKARAVMDADDQVDEMYDDVFRVSLTHMMQNPATIRAMTEYLMVARHLERVADNAVKVAEKSLYIATGERRRRSDGMQTLKDAGGRA